jgi:hypothetical protein
VTQSGHFDTSCGPVVSRRGLHERKSTVRYTNEPKALLPLICTIAPLFNYLPSLATVRAARR